MSPKTTRLVAIVLLAALALPLLAACGSPKSPAEPTKAAPVSAGEPTDEPAAPAKPGSSAVDAQVRVNESLSLLTGSGGDSSVLPSFHIEINGSSPMFDRDSKGVKDSITDLKADVQGENMRLLYDDDGETVEGYVIKEDSGDTKEYEVKDGELREAFAVSMAWVAWPLDIIAPFSLAAIGAEAAGSEAIDGRQAEVYTIDMTKGDQTVRAGVQAFIGEGVTAAVGKVWVDQETGALLRLILDWEEDVYDVTSGEDAPVGHGSGHYEIEVSQVGKVSVSLP